MNRAVSLIALLLSLNTTLILAGEKIEIKYLAPNAEILQQVKSQFHLDEDKTPEKMTIYFFDTVELILLKEQKIVLRLRRKKDKWEFTVKERPASDGAQKDPGDGEVVAEKTVGKPDSMPSYSLNSAPSDAAVKDAIETNAVQGLLSAEQQSFLRERSQQIHWKQVRCFPKIDALRWDLQGLEKLDAEDWKFDGGELLELSLSAKEKNADSADAGFSKFLSDNKIDPALSGDKKTSTALAILKERIH